MSGTTSRSYEYRVFIEGVDVTSDVVGPITWFPSLRDSASSCGLSLNNKSDKYSVTTSDVIRNEKNTQLSHLPCCVFDCYDCVRVFRRERSTKRTDPIFSGFVESLTLTPQQVDVRCCASRELIRRTSVQVGATCPNS